MTDTVDQPVTQEPTPESTDLNDDVVSRLEKLMDSRFSGFQSVLDKNISTVRNEFASQLEEVRRSSMTPGEREELEEREQAAEIARLKKENELLKLRKDYPEEVDFLSDWLEKQSFEDQLRLLNSFRNANRESGSTPREEPTDNEPAKKVDLNNAPRKGGDALADILRSTGTMTREQAQKLLEATNEKGIIARLRRQE